MQNKVYDIRKRSYLFGLAVIKFLEALPRDYISDALGRQLLRSSTSVGANIVEAQGSRSKRDFANFCTHALKSANESRFWLELLKDSKGKNLQNIDYLIEEVKELANILASSIISLRSD